MFISGLMKVDNRICMVLEWTPEETSLLQDRPFSAAASSVYISRSMGDSEPPDIKFLYETCACFIHTIYIPVTACALLLIHSMINYI